MRDADGALGNAVRDAHAHVGQRPAPGFEEVWAAAEWRAAGAHRRHRLLAGAAAAAAVLAIAIGLRLTADDEWRYVDHDELLESTGWSAPSDSLLPHRELDLYESVPMLIESTDTYGGALL